MYSFTITETVAQRAPIDVERSAYQRAQHRHRVVAGGDIAAVRGVMSSRNVAQQLLDHRLLRVEVVIEAARQDPGRVRDLADGRGRETSFCEQLGRDRQDLVAPLGTGANCGALLIGIRLIGRANLARAWSGLLQWAQGHGSEGDTDARRVQGFRR